MRATLPRNTFASITGKPVGCVHEEGKEPLLRSWLSGDRSPHPGWHEASFWQTMTHQVQVEEAQIARRAARTSKEDHGDA